MLQQQGTYIYMKTETETERGSVVQGTDNSCSTMSCNYAHKGVAVLYDMWCFSSGFECSRCVKMTVSDAVT